MKCKIMQKVFPLICTSFLIGNLCAELSQEKPKACFSHKLCSKFGQNVFSDESNVFDGKVYKPFRGNTLGSDEKTNVQSYPEVREKNRLPPPPPPPTTKHFREPIVNDTYRAGKSPDKEITPSAGARVSNVADFFITADFIWWKAKEDGLAYAKTGVASEFAIDPHRGKYRHPDFEYNPGFKIGLGLTLNHDNWDVFTQYTWLHSGSNHSKTKQNLPSTTIKPTWMIDQHVSQNPDNLFTFAKGTWDLHFNVIDLELGRNFFISEYLKLRPFIGLKGTWQDQEYRVTYEYLDINTMTDIRQQMKQDMEYWGIGIRGGLDTAWHIYRSFSLFGNLALTALWTDFDVQRKDKRLEDYPDPDSIESIILSTKNDFHSLKPIIEFIIGLRWETWWNDDDYHFSIEAGWEEQIWWSFNQFIHITEESAHGDLLFHGLTLKARFDF